MISLNINNELKNFIDPLTKEEYEKLEDSILKDGCRDPLVAWVEPDQVIITLIDGHNRYEICTKHNIDFDYVLKDGLRDINEVKKWMILNQLGKRNLNPNQASYYRGMLYNSSKKESGGRSDRDFGEDKMSLPRETTAEKIAQQTGVSDKTIKRDGLYAKTLSEIETVSPELKKDIVSGEKLTKSDVVKIAKLEPEAKQDVIEKISTGEAKSVKEAKKQIEIQDRVEKIEETSKQTDSASLPIHLGSAPDVLKILPENSVDMVLTDPPYGVNYQDSRQSFNPDYKDDSDYALELLDVTCKELKRVAKDDAHLYFFCGCVNAFEFKKIIGKYFDVQDNWITWVKNNHTICDFDRRYASKYEIIWFCTNKERNLNYKLSPDVLNFDIPREKKHQAQKPNDLLEYLIGNSTVEGETVLDCFAGSGSTLKAAKNLKREFIGIEFEPEIHAIAIDNVS